MSTAHCHPRRRRLDPDIVQPHSVSAAASGGSAMSRKAVAEVPPLTPNARRLIRLLQEARKQLVTARAGGGSGGRPSLAGDRAAARRKLASHERQVQQCWEQLHALGFSSEAVGHHILTEGIF